MNQFCKVATFAVAILTLGLMSVSCSTTKTIENADLEGYWSLKSLEGQEAKDAFKGSIPSLEFNFEKGTINGSAGCNTYFGGYTLEENVFNAPNLASTNRLCVEENKEYQFMQAFSATGLLLSVDKDVLTFKNETKTVLEFNRAQAPSTTTNQTAIVTNENMVGKWRVSKINGEEPSKLFGENAPTLIIDKEGNVSGNAGCNNYRSKVTLAEGAFTFTPLASTRMACDHLQGEQIYSTLLDAASNVSLNAGRLVFSQKGNTVLEFVQETE